MSAFMAVAPSDAEAAYVSDHHRFRFTSASLQPLLFCSYSFPSDSSDSLTSISPSRSPLLPLFTAPLDVGSEEQTTRRTPVPPARI